MDRGLGVPLAHAARLRAVVPAVAGVAFAAADLEPAPRALERAVPPLHVSAAAQADLDDLADERGGHASTLGREEDGYDGLSGAVAEWLGRGLQSLVQQFESARRLVSSGFEPGSSRRGEAINHVGRA